MMKAGCCSSTLTLSQSTGWWGSTCVLLILSFHSLCPSWLYGAPPSTSPGTSVSCLHTWTTPLGVKPSIQFTVKVESESKLPFLDFCSRENQMAPSQLLYLEYPPRDRYLDFMAWHSLAQKPAVVKTCTGGPEQSVRTWRLRTRKPDTSDKPLSTMGIPEECCSTMSHHYPVDWDKVREVEQQPCLHHRLSLESINIRSHPHKLNRNDGTLSPLCKIAFLLDFTYRTCMPKQPLNLYSTKQFSPLSFIFI